MLYRAYRFSQEGIVKRFLIAVVMASMSIFPVSGALAHERAPSFNKFPDSHRAAGVVLDSYPVYAGGGTTTRRVCENVQVPIYAQGGGNQAGDIVGGAVVGGILGRMVSGNSSGATAGAIVGGMVGANQHQNRIVGYRTERQCNDVQVSNNRVKYYESRIQLEGRIYRVRTSSPFQQGGTVHMWVHN